MSSLSLDRFFDDGVRKGLLVSVLAHVALLVFALVLTGDGTVTMMYSGGNAVTVEMVTLVSPEALVEEAVVVENPVVVEETVEVIEETPIQENPVIEETSVQENPVIEENPVQENPVQSFMSVDSEGEAGSGAPGPATYESRVFNAIRRNFRTSVQPGQSYRMRFVVNTDGSVEWVALRSSGEPAFDRAVEHALTMASVPPIPPGRTEPVVLNIEFFGPE